MDPWDRGPRSEIMTEDHPERVSLPIAQDILLPAHSEAKPCLSQESGFELFESPKAQSIAEGDRGHIMAEQSLRAPADSPQVQKIHAD